MSNRRISFRKTVRFGKSHKETDRVRLRTGLSRAKKSGGTGQHNQSGNSLVAGDLHARDHPALGMVARRRRRVSLSEALASIIARLARRFPVADCDRTLRG